MKKLCILLAAVIVMALASACSSTNDKLESCVPADAIGVVKIDVPQLLEASGINSNGTIAIPDDLKEVIDNGDDRLLTHLLRHLPKAGINTDANAYMYFTKKTFRSVVLIALDDDDATRKLVEQQSGQKFRKLSGVDFITIKDDAYAIANDILMVGRFNMPTPADDAAKVAHTVLDGGKSLLEQDDVRKAIDADGAVTAYFEMKGLSSLLKKDETLRELQQKFPLLGIFIDSDIKTITSAIKLDGEAATINTHFHVDKNSEYMDLLNLTLSKPSNEVLKAIPASMQYIISMSIKGDKFVQLQQMQQMLQLINQQAGLAQVDIGKMLSTVDGPLTIGFLRDEQSDDWNAVIAAESNDPDMAMKHITEFANTMGQEPYIKDGNYIYEYDNKAVKMGVDGGIFFIKILSYDDSQESTAYDLPDIKDFFASKRVGVFAQTSINNKTVGYINYGLKTNTEGEGLFYTANEKDNVALTLIKILCSFKAGENPDDYM